MARGAPKIRAAKVKVKAEVCKVKKEPAMKTESLKATKSVKAEKKQTLTLPAS